MIKNKILLSGMVIPCVTITSVLSISCGGRNEINNRIPLNYYIEDKSINIFDEDKWRNKRLRDVNLDFIKSTILENDKYVVEIYPNEKYLFKNEDLNFVSFIYRYGLKSDSSGTTQQMTNWLVQTIHGGVGGEKEISLEEFWKLAEEKGQASSDSGASLYKISFDSSTANYSSDGINVYYNMSQKFGHYFTLPSYIDQQDFFSKYGRRTDITKRFQVETYSKDKGYFYQEFIQIRGQSGDKATITYLTKDVKIKRIDVGNNKYIKFEIPAGSIKLSIDGKEYFNDFSDSLYINITDWFK